MEVLDEVKVESQSPAPNKMRITGLLQGAGGALSAIRNAPEAFANLMTAWDALKQML